MQRDPIIFFSRFIFFLGFGLVVLGGNAVLQADSAPAVPFQNVEGDDGLKVDVFHVKTDEGFQATLGYPDIYKARKYALEHDPDYSFTNVYINQGTNRTASISFQAEANAATKDFLGAAAADAALNDQNPLNSGTTITRDNKPRSPA